MQLPVWLLCTSLVLVCFKGSHLLVSGTQENLKQEARLASAQISSRNQADKRNLRRHIRVVTLESPPFMMKRRPGDTLDTPAEWGAESASSSSNSSSGNSTIWYGYCMDFFLELLKQLPYEVSYEIRGVADGKFGSKRREIFEEKTTTQGNKTGGKLKFKRVESWNGLVGELQQQRAELALAPMAVMAERELEIDFTVPFYDLVGIQILLKRPEVPQNWFKFLTVLDNEVWLSIALAYFVTSFIIYLFDRLSPYSHKNQARIRHMRERRANKLQQQPTMSPLPAPAVIHAFKPAASDAFGHLSRALTGGAGDAMKARPGRREDGRQEEEETVKEFRHIGTLSSAAPASAIVPLQTTPLNASELLAKMSSVSLEQAPSPARRLSQDYLTSLRARFGVATADSASGKRQANEDGDSEDSDEGSESENDGKPDFNLRDSLWFCITSLTPQGGGEAPQNLSGRVVAGAWWLFCFIVIASYTANLAAFLTVSRLDIPIESLDDLAKQYRIKYAPIDGTAEQTYFERMAYIEEIFYNIWKEMSLNESLSEQERSKFSVWDYPISDKYTKIWSQIQEVGLPQTIEGALERVRASKLDDGFALLADANLIKYAIMTDCSLKAVGEEFSRKPVALALAKGHTELRDDISYAILQLINKRFMEVLREKWWTNNPARLQCQTNDDSEGISIENIGGVFIIILAGILLSFLVWAIERLAYNTKLDVSRNLLEQQQQQQQQHQRRQANQPKAQPRSKLFAQEQKSAR